MLLTAQQKNERQATQELIVGMHDPALSPTILNQLSNADLLKWLKKMPKSYYDVFNLYIVDGFSHAEIANLLQIEEAVSRKRLSRGRAWLKARLPSGVLSSINFN
ncbi:MAG: sigma-70 family RNA polymerase sigma factor [Bacteroidota bacterium]